MTWLVLALLVLVALLVEGWVWPVRTCRACRGRGEFRSPLWGTRPCSCDGGRVLKWRARLLGRRAED